MDEKKRIDLWEDYKEELFVWLMDIIDSQYNEAREKAKATSRDQLKALRALEQKIKGGKKNAG